MIDLNSTQPLTLSALDPEIGPQLEYIGWRLERVGNMTYGLRDIYGGRQMTPFFDRPDKVLAHLRRALLH